MDREEGRERNRNTDWLLHYVFIGWLPGQGCTQNLDVSGWCSNLSHQAKAVGTFLRTSETEHSPFKPKMWISFFKWVTLNFSEITFSYPLRPLVLGFWSTVLAFCWEFAYIPSQILGQESNQKPFKKQLWWEFVHIFYFEIEEQLRWRGTFLVRLVYFGKWLTF